MFLLRGEYLSYFKEYCNSYDYLYLLDGQLALTKKILHEKPFALVFTLARNA